MTTEILNWFDTIKNTLVSQQNELQEKDKKINDLIRKNDDLNDELANLKKVSLVAGLTRQLDEKNSQLTILRQQIDNLRSKGKK